MLESGLSSYYDIDDIETFYEKHDCLKLWKVSSNIRRSTQKSLVYNHSLIEKILTPNFLYQSNIATTSEETLITQKI